MGIYILVDVNIPLICPHSRQLWEGLPIFVGHTHTSLGAPCVSLLRNVRVFLGNPSSDSNCFIVQFD